MSERPAVMTRAFLSRLGIVYWTLWGMPLVLMQLARLTPFPSLAPQYWRLWDPLTGVVGASVLGFVEKPVWRDSGGSDLPFYWTLVLVQLGVSVIVAALWTALARAREDDDRLRHGLSTGLRFLLGVILLEYGAAKLIKVQFPLPRLEVLATPLGDLTPDGLLWAFMGVSPAYNIFAGLMEFVPGALLFFRRTAMLGALLAVAALANVLVLNIGYDVPVKLQLLHLLLIGFLLVGPRATHLFAALLPRDSERPRRWFRVFQPVPVVVLVLAGGLSLAGNWRDRHEFGDLAPRPPLYGTYRADSVRLDPDSFPPAWQWARIIVPLNGRAVLARLPDGQVLRSRMSVDTIGGRIVLSPSGQRDGDEDVAADTLIYHTTGSGLAIAGRLRGQSLDVNLRRIASDEMELFRHPFKWVSDK